jgi:hypothetical protein
MAKRLPSQGPGRGPSVHAPDCTCTRCTGFQPGHALRRTHGAYLSPAALSEETTALAAELAPLVPAYSDSDAIAVELLALVLRRIARAEPVVAAAEDAGDPDAVERLQRAQRGWVNSATRLLDLLAMFPGSRAKLGLDVARMRSELDDLAGEGRRIRLATVDGEGES